MAKIHVPLATSVLIFLIAQGLPDLSLAVQLVSDNETENNQQSSQAETASDLSPRERRRAERLRLRELEGSDEPDLANSEAETTNINRSEPEVVIVVEVEPEMKCRREAVTGSRVSREICTPVVSLAETERQEEENAQEFLRRTRELSTVVPPEEANNPFLTPSAFD
jgi:hypothetical protein